ncbi:MAG: hypothetical protein EZS28_010527 [Streblomastix strix]|uniref:Uncharacterized protein n=1 Tax=Streblomastix strix TaxID=222440 RepID=A0A5J4WG20_9EUKA|nr:MAG: hypothetical protein EZS28_010527 [Streblomastix strix]
MNSISTAGGCLEEDDDLISRTFGDVIGVSYKLSKKKVKQYPDSVLDIRMKEEIELEGGLEEIEANIYHLLEKINDDVQEQALETKNEINNTYKEGSNRNEDDEESDSFSEDIQDDLNDEIGEVLVNVGYFPLNRIFKDSDQ